MQATSRRSRIGILARWLIAAAAVLGVALLAVWFVNWRIEATWIGFARNFARTEGNPVVRALYKFREDTGAWPADIHVDLVPKYVDHIEPGIWFSIKDGKPYFSRNCRPGPPEGDVWLNWDFDRKTWTLGKIDFGPLDGPAD